MTLFTQGPGNAGGAQARHYPVLGGRITGLTGWLGAFELQWAADNPIDLDLHARCNACVAACPENAIGLGITRWTWRLRQPHRACVKACQVAGAIDFTREATAQTERFDLVLDLRSATATPTFCSMRCRRGICADGRDLANAARAARAGGRVREAPVFCLQTKLCAHSRNETVGCNACVDICSAEAVSSDKSRQRIVVNPSLCVGCGACTTVCPTGALTCSMPTPAQWSRASDSRPCCPLYAAAGGKDAAPSCCTARSVARALVEELGRAAQLKLAHGVPAHVIPVALCTRQRRVDLRLSEAPLPTGLRRWWC